MITNIAPASPEAASTQSRIAEDHAAYVAEVTAARETKPEARKRGNAAALRQASVELKTERKAQPGKTEPRTAPKLASEIQAAASLCSAYGVATKTWGKATAPSMVIKMPEWSKFKAALPEGDEGADIARTFLALRDAVEVLCGDAKATWVIHSKGSFALYGKLA